MDGRHHLRHPNQPIRFADQAYDSRTISSNETCCLSKRRSEFDRAHLLLLFASTLRLLVVTMPKSSITAVALLAFLAGALAPTPADAFVPRQLAQSRCEFVFCLPAHFFEEWTVHVWILFNAGCYVGIVSFIEFALDSIRLSSSLLNGWSSFWSTDRCPTAFGIHHITRFT